MRGVIIGAVMFITLWLAESLWDYIKINRGPKKF